MLAYVLKKLNEQYEYGLKLILLSVDEGITGYRDDSLEVHLTKAHKKTNKQTYIHVFINDTIIMVTLATFEL